MRGHHYRGRDSLSHSAPRDAPAKLALKANDVLRRNDMGGWTKAAPELYPHQWSWDSAFIAIGLAHLDTRRAVRELETLLAHQWKTGKVPHIVFNEEAPPESYFPVPEHWACAATSPDAPPAPPYTSYLSQPPVHAIGALRIWEAAQRGSEDEIPAANTFLISIYPRLLSWHRYILTYRDPERSGLVTIYHPWESGTDNSPRWDAPLEALEVGDVGPYPRHDLQHVGSPSQRPTNAECDRYLWLVNLIKPAGCDEATIYETHPFLVNDVLTSAILVAANEALLEIADLVGAPEGEQALIAAWMARGRQGLEGCWDAEFGSCLDYDLSADRPLRVRTVAGFAPLIAGGLSRERLGALLETFDSPAFLGHRGLRWPLPPSTSPEDPRFKPRSYSGADRRGRWSTGSSGGLSFAPASTRGPRSYGGRPWTSSPSGASGSTSTPSPATPRLRRPVVDCSRSPRLAGPRPGGESSFVRIRIRWDRASSTQASGAKRPFTVGIVILFILVAVPMLGEVILNVR